MYASTIIIKYLPKDTNRTVEDISAEIFAHQFFADVVSPLSLLSGHVPDDFDIYGRLSEADIYNHEKRISFYKIMEEVFEWE